ncbi:hypothetical protein GEMRC1_000642 [Eukaryota sp. GEM-RC1]
MEEVLQRSGTVAVLTPYMTQVQQLNVLFNESKMEPQLENVDVSATDAYQGKEVNVAFISTVITWQSDKADQSLGFLTDKRRKNVMFTRARFSNILFGHGRLLRSNPH